MKTLLVSTSLIVLVGGLVGLETPERRSSAHDLPPAPQEDGAYVGQTFANAAAYQDECVRQYHVSGGSLIDYMRRTFLHDDGHWCVVRCILRRANLLDGPGDTPHAGNVHAQMQYSNAIVEDPDDIRSETERCMRELEGVDDPCRRAYMFFACIQSTEYDLF